MNFKDAARYTYSIAGFMIESYFQGITPEKMLMQPAPDANHLAWQLGHLISAECRLVDAAVPGSMPQLPAGFAKRHTKDPANRDKPSDFLSKDKYMSLTKPGRAASLKTLDGISNADLDKPV